MTIVARTTDVYRKMNGKWFIVEEHNSVPVDLETMKPDLLSKLWKSPREAWLKRGIHSTDLPVSRDAASPCRAIAARHPLRPAKSQAMRRVRSSSAREILDNRISIVGCGA